MLGKRNSRAKDTSFWKTVKDFQAMTAERHSCKGPCLEAFQVLGWVFPGCYGPCSLRSYDLKEDDTDQNRAGMQCEGETWVRDAGKQVWGEGGDGMSSSFPIKLPSVTLPSISRKPLNGKQEARLCQSEPRSDSIRV